MAALTIIRIAFVKSAALCHLFIGRWSKRHNSRRSRWDAQVSRILRASSSSLNAFESHNLTQILSDRGLGSRLASQGGLLDEPAHGLPQICATVLRFATSPVRQDGRVDIVVKPARLLAHVDGVCLGSQSKPGKSQVSYNPPRWFVSSISPWA